MVVKDARWTACVSISVISELLRQLARRAYVVANNSHQAELAYQRRQVEVGRESDTLSQMFRDSVRWAFSPAFVT